MKFLRSWQFAVVVFVAFTACVVIALVYGISTHEEPGIEPGAHRWSHVPLIVWGQHYWDTNDDPATSDPLTPDEEHALAYAVNTVNERLGFTMLTYTPREFRTWPNVTVNFGVPVGVGDTGECEDAGGNYFFDGGAFENGEIQICNTGTAELRQLVIQHELGHALGLAHDDFESSIMRRSQSPTPERQLPPTITDFDRAQLRLLYRP